MAEVQPVKDLEALTKHKGSPDQSTDSKSAAPKAGNGEEKDIEKSPEDLALEQKRKKIAYFMGAYAAIVLAIGNYLVADLSAKFGIWATVFQCYTYIIIGVGYHVYEAFKY